MNECGKSDRPIVPRKPANKGGVIEPAEWVEGRGLAKGNPDQSSGLRTQSRVSSQEGLARIRQAASRDKRLRFTALWHHVYEIDRLRAAYRGLKRDASAGVDDQTWQQYGLKLEDNLRDLSDRLRRGAYRAKPVRRVYLPKADGGRRPIGVPTLEDKIVQRSVAEVLGAVYETDFKGFSYGFRPRRGPHDALDALSVGITRKKVNWVLDTDIRGFFDTLDHGWLVKFLEHRIADQRVVRHVKKWLNAGVLEEGVCSRPDQGTPQGGSISPLLANLYLHYVFDLWIDRWRRTQAHGDVIVVRYADDFVVGFQHRSDAQRLMQDLQQRLRRFNLELKDEKTRLLEFGRFAAERRQEHGEGKPETFNFLGLTHICGRDQRGWFVVLRQTDRRRMQMKLREIKQSLARRWHAPLREVGPWLRSILIGHYQFYGVPRNYPAMKAFRFALIRLWHQALGRRSQKGRLRWSRMPRLAKQWLPVPKICHPYPEQRLVVMTRGRSPVR